MTTTEILDEVIGIYLENGWITPKQVREIERNSLIMAFGIVLLPIAFGVLFYILVSY